jgi:hypothetical protein
MRRAQNTRARASAPRQAEPQIRKDVAGTTDVASAGNPRKDTYVPINPDIKSAIQTKVGVVIAAARR